eukprot:360740-Chlamydomonas_euryale.AAC.11
MPATRSVHAQVFRSPRRDQAQVRGGSSALSVGAPPGRTSRGRLRRFSTPADGRLKPTDGRGRSRGRGAAFSPSNIHRACMFATQVRRGGECAAAAAGGKRRGGGSGLRSLPCPGAVTIAAISIVSPAGDRVDGEVRQEDAKAMTRRGGLGAQRRPPAAVFEAVQRIVRAAPPLTPGAPRCVSLSLVVGAGRPCRGCRPERVEGGVCRRDARRHL